MKRLVIVAFCAVLFVVAAGCGNVNRVPRYNMSAPLEIETFKRLTLHENRDFIYTWKKDAYSKVTKPLRYNNSEDMRDALTRHGQPDYLRQGWKSTSNEIVDEWVYWDRDMVLQFVQNQLVYEGELTDMDKYRVRYGYPRRAWQQVYETGVRRDFWDYQNIGLDAGGRIVSFTNGSLVSENIY